MLASAATDLAGNASLAADSGVIEVDSIPPQVSSIVRVDGNDTADQTDGVTDTSPEFRVTFTESMDETTVTAADFTLSNGTISVSLRSLTRPRGWLHGLHCRRRRVCD